jgi:hypothetical protein
MFLTKPLLRLLNPIVWRRGRAAKKFSSFALAEQASMVDMMEAKLFRARSAELRQAQGLGPLDSTQADTEGLFAALGEEFFLAFVHLGEALALEQFGPYIAYFEAKGQTKNRALLAGIRSDECRHEEYTLSLLVELCGSEKVAKKAIARARRWRVWRAWRRIGRNLSAGLHGLLMLTLFVACAPLALLIRVFAPSRGGWRQLK